MAADNYAFISFAKTVVKAYTVGAADLQAWFLLNNVQKPVPIRQRYAKQWNFTQTTNLKTELLQKYKALKEKNETLQGGF